MIEEEQLAQIEAFFTTRGDTLHAILPRWPSPPVDLKDVRPIGNMAVRLLGTGEPIRWRSSGAELVVDLPQFPAEEPPLRYAYTRAITGAGQDGTAAPAAAAPVRVDRAAALAGRCEQQDAAVL